jgi:hypothetical protein
MVINYRHFAAAGQMDYCYRNAEDWVRFAADHATTPVLHWEFGNEVYFREHGVDPDHYAASYDALRRRLRRIHPGLQLGLALGNYWNPTPAITPRFNERALARLSTPPDFIILHFYPDVKPETFTTAGMNIRQQIRWFRNGLQQRGYPPDLPIYVTEWNASSHGRNLKGQTIGHQLSIAQGLLELSDAGVQCATFWPLHDYSKALMQEKTYALLPAGQMFRRMRQAMSGTQRLPVTLAAPAPDVELAAFRDAAAHQLRVLLLNRHATRAQSIQLTLPDTVAADTTASRVTLLPQPGTAPSLNTTTTREERTTLRIGARQTSLTLPALSLTTVELPESGS